jgi:hypothetical protein
MLYGSAASSVGKVNRDGTMIATVRNVRVSFSLTGSTLWRSCLRHCAKSRKATGSVSDGVFEISHWRNPSGRTLGTGVDSAANRNEFQGSSLGGGGGVKTADALGWQPYDLNVRIVWKPWEPQTPGALRACVDLHRYSFTCNFRVLVV